MGQDVSFLSYVQNTVLVVILASDAMAVMGTAFAISLICGIIVYAIRKWIGAVIFIMWYTYEQLLEYLFHIYVSVRYISSHPKAKAHDILNEIDGVALKGAENEKPVAAGKKPSADRNKPDAALEKPFEAWDRPITAAEKNPIAEKPMEDRQAALDRRADELAQQRLAAKESRPAQTPKAPAVVKKPDTKRSAGKKGAPRSSDGGLEAKREAAREYMRKKRAREKAEGLSKAELARRRAYNREEMRRLRQLRAQEKKG
jgi:hypothetical protein